MTGGLPLVNSSWHQAPKDSQPEFSFQLNTYVNSPYITFSLSLSLMLWPTVSRSVCLEIKYPTGVYDQIFITVRQLRVYWSGPLSLTRGQICRLQLLLALASAVILGSESCGTHDHILLSQIWDVHFRHLLQPAGLWWRFLNWPPHGRLSSSLTGSLPLITSPHRPCRHHCFSLLLHCCILVCWGDHVIATEPLPRNSRCLQIHYLATACCIVAYFTVVT
jgi:hypothetical protein